jgi:hypothetical protein
MAGIMTAVCGSVLMMIDLSLFFRKSGKEGGRGEGKKGSVNRFIG